MNKHAIYHLTDTPWAYARDEDTLALRIRTASNDMRRVTVFYKDRYDWFSPWLQKDLEIMAKTELFSYWTTDLKVPRNRYRYFFELEDQNQEVVSYDEQGFEAPGTTNRERNAFQFAYIGPADVYHGKDHLVDSIVYQIFPERFHNGDPSNDPEGTMPWGGLPRQRNSFGGDLKGIIEKIDYLEDLRIDLIYLTPIFKSSSNHKYNISDYYAVDPQFGTLEDAKELVRVAHKVGIRVFFDAVFNHTGSDFFAFQDVLEKQDQSKYYDWYHIDSFPVSIEKLNYYTFANKISTMPKLRTENPEVRDYFFEVGRYWIREIGIDGWRLDVCDEVDHEFWHGFRKACEEENPKAALVGEIMHESSAFLKGKELDSIMNYPFLHAMIDFFAKRISNAHHFMDILARNRIIYMNQITRQMWNLLGSHDISRFLTFAKGEKKRLKLASAFQFLYIGTPYIYYGDEVGLDGGHDPLCRRCMEWDEAKQDTSLLSHYKGLIKLRKSSAAFSRGDFKEVLRDEAVIGFSRKWEEEEFLCFFNNSDGDQTFSLKDMHLKKVYLKEVTPLLDMPEGEEERGLTRHIETQPRHQLKFIDLREEHELTLEPMSYRVFKVEM